MATTKLTELFVASLPLPAPGKNRIYYDSDVRGFAVRITPTGYRGYLFCYVIDRRERRMPIGAWLKGAGTITAARERAAGLRLEVQSGKDPAREKELASEARQKERHASAKEITFERMATRYIAEHAVRKRTGSCDVRRIKKYLLPAWANRKVKDITRADVYEMVAPVAAAGFRGEANQRLALIRKMFSFSVDVGILDVHPCLRMKAPGGPVVPRERALVSERELRIFWRITNGGIWRRFLTDSESGALRLMLLTGCRPGEATGLARREIDLHHGLWHLPAERSKNQRAHVIPLLPDVVRMLREYCAGPANDYVFVGRRSAHTTQNQLGRSIREVSRRLKRLGIAPFTPHDLRRTVETGMAIAKVPKEHRDRVLNHVDSSVGGRHYNKHDYLDEKRQALAEWHRRLETLLNEQRPVVVPLKKTA
jgi:integrase